MIISFALLIAQRAGAEELSRKAETPHRIEVLADKSEELLHLANHELDGLGTELTLNSAINTAIAVKTELGVLCARERIRSQTSLEQECFRAMRNIAEVEREIRSLRY